MRIPDGLLKMASSEDGRAWLEAVPGLYERAVDRWSLRVGAPYPYAYASLAAPAELADGTQVVLKLAFPDRESRQEAAALPAGTPTAPFASSTSPGPCW